MGILDKISGQTVFHIICSLGHLKLLMFMKSMFLYSKSFVEQMFLSNGSDQTCIECAVKYSQVQIIKYLFDMNGVRDQYKNNDPMIFRLCFHLFVWNSNSDLTDYVLSRLQISKEKVIKMLSYKCPQQPGFKQGAIPYNYFTMITRVILIGSFGHLQRLIDVIGKQAFVENVFNLNKSGNDVMHCAVQKKNLIIIEYILSMDEIKKKYLSDNDLLFRLVSTLNKFIENKEAVRYIVDALGLTETKLEELNAFRAIDISKIVPFTR